VLLTCVLCASVLHAVCCCLVRLVAVKQVLFAHWPSVMELHFSYPGASHQHIKIRRYQIFNPSFLDQMPSYIDLFAAPLKYSVAMLVKLRQLSDRCSHELVLALLVFCSSMKSMHLSGRAVLAAVEKVGAMWCRAACLPHFLQKWMASAPVREVLC
jgi:hypothetical protein